MSGIIEELNGRNREIVEKYETVRMWISKKCGSSETARNYIPNLLRFCKHYKTNPDACMHVLFVDNQFKDFFPNH